MDKNKIKNLPIDALFEKLGTSVSGLTSNEAEARLKLYGPNVFKDENKNSSFRLFVKQFKSSLIYLLLAADVIAYALKDIRDGIIISVILLINTGLSFYQTYKSEKAVEELERLIKKDVLVIRDDQQLLTSETTLVQGDVVILRQGDIVPADIILYEVNDLSIDESPLTGETTPVIKSIRGEGALTYAGSIIEQGEGRGIVFATARKTELGKIAKLSSDTNRVTQFEKSLSSFSGFLVKVTFITLLILFVLKIILVQNTSEIGSLLIFIIALSIAVVPEAMPVIVTIALSRGAVNLARQHVIVKTLTSVEDLGNINILCSDKTGTLTENRLTVKKLVADDSELFNRLAIASIEVLNEKRKQFQSSFDKAFLDFIPESIKHQADDYKRLEELPFDPSARRRRVVFRDGQKTYLVEVGSAETLLELSHDPRQKKYLQVIKAEGAQGLRHLAIAYKEVKYTTDADFDILEHEDNLKFVGYVTLEDPLRPSAKHTIKLAEGLGVIIKILSGDSREVTQYVASEVGLIDKNQMVYTGDEIDGMSDSELSDILKVNNAYARLNPEQKYRIIGLLKLHGSVVGYQGDGINDAPALKLADVAVAVNSATDVAKESSDILLLHNDLNVIVNGVKFGRGIFSNINKYIRYTMTSSFGAFFAIGALYLIANRLPLLTIQLLLSSLISDLPLVAISTDNVDNNELLAPSRYNGKTLYGVTMFLGMYTALFYLVFYAIIKDHPIGVTQTSMYMFMTITNLIVIFSVRNKLHFWRATRMSSLLRLAIGSVAAVVIAAIYLKPTQHIFSFVGLSSSLIGIIVVMTAIYFILLDLTKVWFYRSSLSDEASPV